MGSVIVPQYDPQLHKTIARIHMKLDKSEDIHPDVSQWPVYALNAEMDSDKRGYRMVLVPKK